ncbi:MAG: tetratricopeptide repeat protein [Elusimicrobia bacterium]|nr:tetratricopeptide repeat protein [Elusimicrobiota bacterium]
MTFLLVVAHFVCPLLFFTDLTRNPYYTQIALLNVALMAAAAGWLAVRAWGVSEGPVLRFPRTAVDAPIAAWLVVCALTWAIGYFGHGPFFRESIKAEGLRVHLFTWVNTVLPFYLGCLVARDSEAPTPGSESEPDVKVFRWVVFTVAWAAAWALFRDLRTPSSPSLDVWTKLWDGYGAFLWTIGLVLAWGLTRRGRLHDFWHLGLAVGFMSAVYGIFQYMNVELIWPKVLNPYGGRSVSTYGNPNFMSSYMVLLLPIALAYYVEAKSNLMRAVYGAVILAIEGCLLCSLTRSSWIGALAAAGFFALAPGLRGRLKEGVELHGLLATASVVMIVFWPQSSVAGYTPSVFGRIGELGLIGEATSSGATYSPFYQRLLIWQCAWLMGSESFLFGKGWGLFELFYPFFQGHILSNFDFYWGVRTHANNTHNEILEVFAQTGIAGVGVTLWLWATFFACAWRWWRRPGDASGPLWGWAAAAGAAGMLADNLLNVSMHFAVPAFLLWWQAGTAMGTAVPPEGRWRERRLPAWAGKALAVVFVGLAAWGARHWWNQWNREVRYFSGFKLMRAGRLASAVEHLETAHRWHAREVNANYELGNAYARSENYTKASWAYDEALKSNAGYDEIYFNKGTVLSQRLGRLAEGLDYFRTAFWLNSTSYEVVAALSGTLLSDPEKNREEAIAVLERAVHVFPDDPGFRNNLGTLYNRRGDRARALKEWTEALRRTPELPQAEQNLLAVVRAGLIPKPKILDELERYRELERKIGAKELDAQTLALARRVAESFPRSNKVKYYRGNLELMFGDAAKSLELLEPIAASDPRNAGLQLNLGQVYAKLGRRDQAIAAFRRALAAEPGNAQAQRMLEALSAR